MNDINKRLCELLGDCWHEQIDDQTLQCKHCGAPLLFPWHQNPDFTLADGGIDLLKRLKAKGCVYEFLARFAFPADFIGFLLDDNGALARVALEFLEAKEASHDRN